MILNKSSLKVLLEGMWVSIPESLEKEFLRDYIRSWMKSTCASIQSRTFMNS